LSDAQKSQAGDLIRETQLKHGHTPEGEAMIVNGARESLDMLRTFYDALNQAMAEID
jgi:hypothetical protein